VGLEPSRQLADDHAALAEVLKRLHSTLDSGDVAASHAELDLFWARLAVHIRAEHLHLFPAVLKRMAEARTSVEALRTDHDFFMRELARAVGLMRDLLRATDRQTIDEGLNAVRNTIVEVEERLTTHNELEETQIYCWATNVLSEQERLELAAQINRELANQPPRFFKATKRHKKHKGLG
jgi:hemerythrin superfamily protein